MTTPSWVSLLADDATICSKDVSEWTGYPLSTLNRMWHMGWFPRPDTGGLKRHKWAHYWKAKTIRDWIKAGKPRVPPSCAVR